MGIFNTFGDGLLKNIYQKSSELEIKNIKSNLNFLFSFGGVVCFITSPLIYDNIGVYKTFIIITISNLLCYGLLLI